MADVADGPVECEECGKKYQMRGWYLKHVEVHRRRAEARSRRLNQPWVRCPVAGCTRSYRAQQAAVHLRNHHGLTPDQAGGQAVQDLQDPLA